MLLECPNCAASFRLKPEALGHVGRTVRCSKCTFEWFAEPRDLRENKPQTPVAEPHAATAEATPAEDTEEDVFAALAGMESLPPQDSEHSSDEDEEEEEDEESRFSLAVSLPLLAGMIAALLFLLISALLYFRTPLSAMGLSGLYETIGMGSTQDVKLSGLSLSKVMVGERTQYSIQGSIINTTDQPIPVPGLGIRLVDKDGNVLRGWKFAQSADHFIKPHETLPFSSGQLESTQDKKAYAFAVDIGNGFEMLIRK